jgi:hypothetical protein
MSNKLWRLFTTTGVAAVILAATAVSANAYTNRFYLNYRTVLSQEVACNSTNPLYDVQRTENVVEHNGGYWDLRWMYLNSGSFTNSGSRSGTPLQFNNAWMGLNSKPCVKNLNQVGVDAFGKYFQN